MGATISQLWAPPIIQVGFVGLPSAGKTAIIHKLSRGQKPTLPLTDTVNTTYFFQGSQQYWIFDYTGDERVRGIWKNLLFGREAIVFVLDSTYRENTKETREALWRVLREEMLGPQPVLILANKQDSPRVMATSAITGEGLVVGLEWMRQIVRNN
ncbi:adp-ribosylation factor [Fusarium langsethiae]|uniref:Adp-ribosylation factor n=1 Tax=Fusarium langsethiae TaxID=179993 RepID=A0A0M9EPY8_FUSLA|nr:adp-ribosylation factor [Fusarium langsethiae]GKU08794.1 unnamed protein product [Fusarium langsethiae]